MKRKSWAREKMEKEIAVDLAILKETSKGALSGPTEHEIAKVLVLQKNVRKKLRMHRASRQPRVVAFPLQSAKKRSEMWEEMQ